MSSLRQAILEHFYDEDPFAAGPEPGFDVDVQGWGSTHAVFPVALEMLRPQVVLEFGTWKGLSAAYMAQTAKRLGLDTTVVCIDTFLGSPELCLSPNKHPTNRDWYNSLRMRRGFPQLYFTFLNNMIALGVADQIVPIPNTTENALEMFRRIGLRSKVIYIDAAHEYGPVLRDAQECWALLNEPGVLIFDDYLTAPGVTEAVNAFARAAGVPVFGQPGKAILARGFDGALLWNAVLRTQAAAAEAAAAQTSAPAEAAETEDAR